MKNRKLVTWLIVIVLIAGGIVLLWSQIQHFGGEHFQRILDHLKH